MRCTRCLAVCLLLHAGLLWAQQPPAQPDQPPQPREQPPPEQPPPQQPPEPPPQQPQPAEQPPARQPTPPDATDTQSGGSPGTAQGSPAQASPGQTPTPPSLSPARIPQLQGEQPQGGAMAGASSPPPERSWDELNALMETPERDPRLPPPDPSCDAQQDTCPLPDVHIDYTLKAKQQ